MSIIHALKSWFNRLTTISPPTAKHTLPWEQYHQISNECFPPPKKTIDKKNEQIYAAMARDLMEMTFYLADSYFLGQSIHPRITPQQTTATKEKKVLYLGSINYNQEIWDTRVKYILPDLLAPIAQNAEIFMVTTFVPDFAIKGQQELIARFAMRWIEIPEAPPHLTGYDYWTQVAWQMVKWIQPDVVSNIFSGLMLGYAGALAARRFGCRSVIRFAGDEIVSRLAIGSYRANSIHHLQDVNKERLALNLADAVIVMSPWEKERLANLAIHRDKVKICMRGIDLNRYQVDPANMERPLRNILFAGRKSLEKGYDIVEAAAKKLFAEKSPVRFFFAGTFAKQSIENREYIGFVPAEKLPQLYANMDALVLPSRSEGFPQVVTEAMAMGLPCIVSHHLFAQNFRDGEDVLLVTIDADDLLCKIKMLLDDPHLKRRLSERSRAIAMANYDKEYWQNVYQTIMFGTNHPVAITEREDQDFKRIF